MAGNGDLWAGCVGVKGRVMAESAPGVSLECITRPSSAGRSGERLGDNSESLFDGFAKGERGEELIWIMLFMISQHNAILSEGMSHNSFYSASERQTYERRTTLTH